MMVEPWAKLVPMVPGTGKPLLALWWWLLVVIVVVVVVVVVVVAVLVLLLYVCVGIIHTASSGAHVFIGKYHIVSFITYVSRFILVNTILYLLLHMYGALHCIRVCVCVFGGFLFGTHCNACTG